MLVQRLGDLMTGHRSTPERIAHGLVRPTLPSATPGDLSFVLPYRYLSDVLEMIEALDRLAPGVASRHTLLYGVEVKFYSARPKLSPCLETEIENLFTIGDGAGVTRGLVQASASGIVTAREILKRKVAGRIGITARGVQRFLGVPKYRYGKVEETDRVGLANGIAWTEFGGELLTTEVAVMPGKG